MIDLDKQRNVFRESVAAGKPYIVITGELMHDLAGRVSLKSDADPVKAINQTLPVIGKGRRKATIPLEIASYLASGLPSAESAAPTETPAKTKK